MIRSVTEGKLASKQQELEDIEKDLIKLDQILKDIQHHKDVKLRERSYLMYEISELKDELEEL